MAEMEAKYEPPRPAGNTPIRIVSGRAYLVKVYTKDGNFWLSRVAGSIHSIGYGPMHGSDFAATMYESKDPDIYRTDEVFVNRVDMVEFEGDAPHSMYKCHDAPHYPTEYVSRGFIESDA